VLIIYQPVVEFNGDQHGSRFIQQKRGTANSDEKEVCDAAMQLLCHPLILG
jgi:hypothetical protein